MPAGVGGWENRISEGEVWRKVFTSSTVLVNWESPTIQSQVLSHPTPCLQWLSDSAPAALSSPAANAMCFHCCGLIFFPMYMLHTLYKALTIITCSLFHPHSEAAFADHAPKSPTWDLLYSMIVWHFLPIWWPQNIYTPEMRAERRERMNRWSSTELGVRMGDWI